MLGFWNNRCVSQLRKTHQSKSGTSGLVVGVFVFQCFIFSPIWEGLGGRQRSWPSPSEMLWGGRSPPRILLWGGGQLGVFWAIFRGFLVGFGMVFQLFRLRRSRFDHFYILLPSRLKTALKITQIFRSREADGVIDHMALGLRTT